jgi:hypothetical protein
MSTFLFAYRAPKGYAPGGPDVAGAWNAWFARVGADVFTDVGNPIFRREAVGNPVGDTELGGYSLVTADSLQAALKVAEGCPIVPAGGAVEVGEITLLDPELMGASGTDHALTATSGG